MAVSAIRGRKLLKLNAVKLIHVDLQQGFQGQFGGAAFQFYQVITVNFSQHFDFQQAQLAVGDNQKVSATTGWIKKGQARQFFVEGLQHFDAVVLAGF